MGKNKGNKKNKQQQQNGGKNSRRRNAHPAVPRKEYQLRGRRTRRKDWTADDYENNRQQLILQLKQHGLYCKDIVGDGNCLFRSLSDQYYGNPKQHPKIRLEVCEYLEAHRDHFQYFVEDDVPFDDHIVLMKQQGTYGGNMELVGFAQLHRVDIKVYQPGRVYVIKGEDIFNGREEIIPDFNTEKETLHIAYHSWEHYSSVRNIGGPHEGAPKIEATPANMAPPINSPPTPDTPSSPNPKEDDANKYVEYIEHDDINEYKTFSPDTTYEIPVICNKDHVEIENHSEMVEPINGLQEEIQNIEAPNKDDQKEEQEEEEEEEEEEEAEEEESKYDVKSHYKTTASDFVNARTVDYPSSSSSTPIPDDDDTISAVSSHSQTSSTTVETIIQQEEEEEVQIQVEPSPQLEIEYFDAATANDSFLPRELTPVPGVNSKKANQVLENVDFLQQRRVLNTLNISIITPGSSPQHSASSSPIVSPQHSASSSPIISRLSPTKRQHSIDLTDDNQKEFLIEKNTKRNKHNSISSIGSDAIMSSQLTQSMSKKQRRQAKKKQRNKEQVYSGDPPSNLNNKKNKNKGIGGNGKRRERDTVAINVQPVPQMQQLYI
ncbi:hypothetical protein G9A89_009118 [Geosiphon pyriformis]|nr:hypothetical protein G9A89_009118 [Geosiphon pyriformis]